MEKLRRLKNQLLVRIVAKFYVKHFVGVHLLTPHMPIIRITEITEPGTMTLEDLRKVVNKDGPYYPTFPGSTNAYADGYITEPPRKPRASYLFFQGIYRGYFGKKFPNSSLSQNMAMVGDAWRALSEEQQAPFILLAKEESQAFEREKELLELAQKPSAMWQPIRRCKAVLDRLCDDPMASIFLEPVDTDVFTDYLDIVEFPMDLRTVRERLENTKNWMGPEGFARDVRKVSISILQSMFMSFYASIISSSILPISLFRCGIIARSITNMVLKFGMSPTTWQSYSSVYCMHGFLTSVIVTYDGRSQKQDLGNTLVV